MAKGSHTTWGAYDSRTCIICGRPIRITTQNAWVHHDDTTRTHTSTHPECGPPLQRRRCTPMRSETVNDDKPDTEPEPEPQPEPDTDDEEEGEDE